MHATSPRFWRIVAVILAVILCLLPFHAFFSTWLGTSIGPLWLWKSWKEIVLVILVLTALVWIIWRKQTKTVFKNPLILILCTYAVLVIAVTLTGSASLDARLAGLAMDLRYLIIFGLGLLLARFTPVIRRVWLLRAPRLLIIAGLVLAVLGVLQVVLLPLNFLEQFGYNKETTIAPYVLIDENEHAPRAFATLRGPNDFGAYLIIPLVTALVYLVRARDKLLIGLAIVAGLAVSASRSAWLAALASVGAAIVDTKQIATRHLVFIGSATIVAIMAALVAAVTIPEVRLAVFHSSPGDSSLTEGSTDAHWNATAAGVQRAVTHPLGCGAGCAGPASYYGGAPRISENYYVQVAETYGILGLIVWVLLFGIVMYQLWRHEEKLATVLFASGIGLSLIGFWLHVWSDDPISLTWWCLVGIVLGVTSGKSAPKTVQ